MPIMFSASTNMNSVNTNGKYFSRRCRHCRASCWRRIRRTARPPTAAARHQRARRMANRVKAVISSAAITMNRAELVKEASMPNSLSGMIRSISNWSWGWAGGTRLAPYAPHFPVRAAQPIPKLLIVIVVRGEILARQRTRFRLPLLRAPHHIDDPCGPAQEQERTIRNGAVPNTRSSHQPMKPPTATPAIISVEGLTAWPIAAPRASASSGPVPWRSRRREPGPQDRASAV